MFQNPSKVDSNNNINSPLGSDNVPQLSKISYGDNLGKNQNYYLSSEKNEIKSLNSYMSPVRKPSLKPEKINEAELIKIINEHQNKYLPQASNEVVENINILKDYKWKLGIILNEKINTLNLKLKEKRERIDKKRKEISETKVYEKKIIYLKKRIKTEESKKYNEEYKTNLDLQKKKKALVDKINQIELNKKKLRENMMKKFNTMMELKEKLKNSINELFLIQQQMRSRKFAIEQEEELKRQLSEKKDREEQELLHLSQNIGEYINKNLLIKDN